MLLKPGNLVLIDHLVWHLLVRRPRMRVAQVENFLSKCTCFNQIDFLVFQLSCFVSSLHLQILPKYPAPSPFLDYSQHAHPLLSCFTYPFSYFPTIPPLGQWSRLLVSHHNSFYYYPNFIIFPKKLEKSDTNCSHLKHIKRSRPVVRLVFLQLPRKRREEQYIKPVSKKQFVCVCVRLYMV